jgi:hypothetical protein
VRPNEFSELIIISVLHFDARSNLKSHEFLHQQLTGIRHLNLCDVSRVLAVVALKPLLSEVAYTHQTALLTDMDAVVVTHIK